MNETLIFFSTVSYALSTVTLAIFLLDDVSLKILVLNSKIYDFVWNKAGGNMTNKTRDSDIIGSQC